MTTNPDGLVLNAWNERTNTVESVVVQARPFPSVRPKCPTCGGYYRQWRVNGKFHTEPNDGDEILWRCPDCTDGNQALSENTASLARVNGEVDK